jgi:UDP-N-acetylmuramoyl-tripeptide--D-alanyl-D-alanine ligase
MQPIRIGEIVAATRGELLQGQDVVVTGVSIDTRTLKPGDLYVAIRGKRLDGHRFVPDALRAGAVAVVVDNAEAAPAGAPAVVVGNTTEALARIAIRHRERMSARVVAIAGSNGKTTTKEMLAAILARRFRTLKPEGSFNNDIGVPLTVLRMTEDIEAAVFEIEMNELGGTARLARVCRPEVGVITNIGDTHLEFMKNREGVAEEKAELLQSLPEDGAAVLNADDPIVMAIGAAFSPARRVTFGLEQKADVFATDLNEDGLAGSRFRLLGRHDVALAIPGRHNVMNCLAACAAACAMGMAPGEMPDAIASFTPPPMRLRIVRLDGVVLIDDCYNANPQSVRAALEVLKAGSPAERRVAFLGDMLELGDQAAGQHESLGAELARTVDRLVLVGPLGEYTRRGAMGAGMPSDRIRRFETSGEEQESLFDIVRVGDTILVKGSRAMAMDLVSQEILRRYGKHQDRTDPTR